MAADVLERTHRLAGPGWWQSGIYRLRCVCGVRVSGSDRSTAHAALAAHAEAEGER